MWPGSSSWRGRPPQKALLCVTADPRALFMQCAPTPTPFLLPHARMGETACLQGEGVGCQLSPAQVGQVGYEELEAFSRLAPPSGLEASMKVSHVNTLAGTLAECSSLPPFPPGLFPAVIGDLGKTSQIGRLLHASPRASHLPLSRPCVTGLLCFSPQQHRPKIPGLWPQGLCTFCSLLECGSPR